MPLYEYQCPACGRRVEKIQPVTAPETETCICGGQMARLVSAPAIQFKGSGWYVTDYAHKSGSPTNGGESKTAAPGGDKAAEKPAAKAGDGGASAPAPATSSSKSK